MLAKQFLKDRKKQLKEEQKRLLRELSRFTKKNRNFLGDFIAKFPKFGSHADENAAEVAEYDKDVSLEHNLEKQLDSVSQALARIKDGNYGICTECKKEINPKRLEAFPAAELCIDCKSKKDSPA